MTGKRGGQRRVQRPQTKRVHAQNAVSTPDPPRPEADIIADLRALCREPGFAHIVTHVIVRDNFIFYRDEMKPADMENLYGFKRLIRTEVATLIGYMVQGGADTFDSLPADPQALLTRAEALLEELHLRLNWSWVESVRSGRFEDERAKGETLREPIFYGGESAFSFQYQDFAIEKYCADDAWLIDKQGFTIENAGTVVEAILSLQEEQVTTRLKAVSMPGACEWTILPGFIVTTDDIQARSRLPRATVMAVVDALSIPLGVNQDFEALNDFNRANASPLIALGGGRYAAFQHYALAEALYEAPFYWMFDDRGYRKIAAKNRGEFTEAFTHRRLCDVFGAANVHRGLNLDRAKGERVGEIDILVEFGGRLLLVQAKSKRLTLEARRGHEGKLREDFKAAVQDAHDQALRCAEALLDPSVRIVGAGGTPIALKYAPTKIYPICLVADHYPALVTQVDRFLVKRAVAKVGQPLVTDIFALDTLCEMLDRPLCFLAYCELRDRFGLRLIYSHEIVLLSYHLRRNLWIEEGLDGMILDDTIGTELEIAMLARRRGIEGAKTPAGPLTAFAGTTFDAMLSRIESRPVPPLVDLGLLMLEASGTSLKAFNDGTAIIVAQARSDFRPHDFSIAMGLAGLTVHCSHEDGRAVRARLEAHVEARKYVMKSDRWFGLFLDPADGLPAAGIMLDFPWTEDPDRARLAAALPRPGQTNAIPAGLKGLGRTRGPGRNDPCPCGSGRKFKKCCG